MIPTLSARDEGRILRALEKLAEDEAADLDPNAALAKVAAEMGLPAGHVNILVRAYNNSRATWQRESGRDVREKAAEHPLADEAEVVGRLYPDRPETPATMERAAGVSPEYLAAPYWYSDPRDAGRADLLLERLATPIAGKAAAAPVEEDAGEAFRRSFKRARAAQERLAAQRLDLDAAEQAAGRALRKLAEALETFGAPAWADVRDNAAALHGPVGLAVMNQVARAEPRLAKLAGTRPYHRVGEHPALYRALATAVATAEALVVAEDSFAGQRKTAEAAVVTELGPFLDAEEKRAVEEAGDYGDLLVLEPKEAAMSKDVAKAFAVSELRDMVDNMVGSFPRANRDAAVDKALGRLGDPMHEARLRDLETQFMLQDLLVNDPVISGHDPHRVADTFNQFSTVAPSYATKPLLMRPQLRRALEIGGPDTFEAHETLDAEHKLRQLNQQHQPAIGGPAHAPAGRSAPR